MKQPRVFKRPDVGHASSFSALMAAGMVVVQIRGRASVAAAITTLNAEEALALADWLRAKCARPASRKVNKLGAGQ